MKQDIADRLEILEGQRAEAKQLRKQARRAHRNNEAELLTKYQLLHLRVLQGRCRGLAGFIARTVLSRITPRHVVLR